MTKIFAALALLLSMNSFSSEPEQDFDSLYRKIYALNVITDCFEKVSAQQAEPSSCDIPLLYARYLEISEAEIEQAVRAGLNIKE